MPAIAIERALGYVRIGVGGLAVAVGLFLLFRLSLIASFRAALIVLAALEVLAFGRRALSRDTRWGPWGELAFKLAVLAVAYVAVGGGI